MKIKNKKINFKSLLSKGIMMKKIIQSLKMNSKKIGIHRTPKTGLRHEIRDYHCNHSTQLTNQFNALKTVTQLPLGGACED